MSKNNVTVTQSGGIGFCGLLTILFITLKLFELTAVASWSWWWVLSPLWIPFAIWLGIFGIILLVGIGGVIIAAALNK